MIDCAYGQLSEEMYSHYCDWLVNALYKILPMKEEHSNTLNEYVNTLLIELIGMNEMIHLINYDADFTSVLHTLAYFLCEDYSVSECKQRVFKSIGQIKNVNRKYFKSKG